MEDLDVWTDGEQGWAGAAASDDWNELGWLDDEDSFGRPRTANDFSVSTEEANAVGISGIQEPYSQLGGIAEMGLTWRHPSGGEEQRDDLSASDVTCLNGATSIRTVVGITGASAIDVDDPLDQTCLHLGQAQEAKPTDAFTFETLDSDPDPGGLTHSAMGLSISAELLAEPLENALHGRAAAAAAAGEVADVKDEFAARAAQVRAYLESNFGTNMREALHTLALQRPSQPESVIEQFFSGQKPNKGSFGLSLEDESLESKGLDPSLQAATPKRYLHAAVTPQVVPNLARCFYEHSSNPSAQLGSLLASR